MIIAGTLNFKIADSHFVNVTQEVLEENSVQKSIKDATKFGILLFTGKI